MGFAAGGRSVETLLVQKQIDAECVQPGQKTDQVLKAATQPIDAPGHGCKLVRKFIVQRPPAASQRDAGAVSRLRLALDNIPARPLLKAILSQLFDLRPNEIARQGKKPKTFIEWHKQKMENLHEVFIHLASLS